MTPKERVLNRISILKEMNKDVLDTENHSLMDVWFNDGVGFCPINKDYLRIACDYEEYDRVVRLYFNLMRIARCL